MTVAEKTKTISFNLPDIGSDEEQAVLKVLRSGWLGYGPVAKEFEAKFSDYLGGKAHCLAVNSCTMGLILALKAQRIGLGSEVITTPLTFAATVNAILAVGATPVFVDVKADGTIDPAKISKAITPFTRAIIPVHIWGTPCDMEPIMDIAISERLIVIEDCAQAFGGSYRGKPLGTFGNYAVFSFYPTKNITSVDGGMIVCRSERERVRVECLASQGLSNGAWNRYGNGEMKTYEVVEAGFKGLMPDVSAAVGLAQLKRWPELRERRFAIWDVYEKAFGLKNFESSQHIFEIRIAHHRDHFRRALKERGVMTGVHYTSLSVEPAFEHLSKTIFPMAEKIGAETLSLPLHTKMSIQDAEFVVETVNKLKGEGE